MTNRYIADLGAQPAALRTTLESLYPASPALTNVATLWASRPWSRIVLTGMGASLYALAPLAYTLAQAGLPVTTIETSELIHFQLPIINQDTLLVIASQSGSSVEILALLEQTTGVARIGVTNTADSPLALQADVVLLTVAGDESTVSCKTYVVTLAALALLGAVITAPDSVAAVHAALLSATNGMENYLGRLDQQRDALDELVGDAQPLIVAGRGPSLAAVNTGALVINEAAKYHAHGMSGAAYRHGPFELTRQGLTAVIFAGTGPTVDLNTRLARDVVAAGGRAVLVGGTQPDAATGVLWTPLPAVEPVALPLVEILPAQMLSLAMARRTGYEPGVFLHGGKITTEE